MIDLAEAYKVVEFEARLFPGEEVKKQTLNRLEFQCEHCNQTFIKDTLNISVFLYGVAIMVGKDISFAGITCPSCLKTILMKGNLTNLYHDMPYIHLEGLDEATFSPTIRYHSSALFSPQQIEYLKPFNIPSSDQGLSDNSADNFHGSFSEQLGNEPYLGKEYLCSYNYNDEVPIGAFASIWWFKPEQIEDLVRIENEHQIRVFPRYVHKMSWHTRYDRFCWQYKLYQEFLAGLKTAAIDTYDQLREVAYRDGLTWTGCMNKAKE